MSTGHVEPGAGPGRAGRDEKSAAHQTEVFTFYGLVHITALVCLVFRRATKKREKLFIPHRPSAATHPSAAECLKYLTGTALFLGLCSVCGGAYVMEFRAQRARCCCVPNNVASSSPNLSAPMSLSNSPLPFRLM